MGQNVREELGRMRKRYSQMFGVSIEVVEAEELLTDDGAEYGRVQAAGFPAWTTGALTRRPPNVRTSQRSK